MSDIDRIKDRIRKLMAYANDGAASDGEIENAMNHAAKLIDAHHLDAGEFEPGTAPAEETITFDQKFATSQGRRFSTWESSLANAVAKLFGCVKWYYSSALSPIRVNGIAQTDKDGDAKLGCRVCFYGPAVEANEAAELFEEWARSIATMGVVRWGGCFRGDGAMYCMGFTTALLNQAYRIQQGREQVQAKAPAQLSFESSAPTTAITLAGRYALLRDGAAKWLKEEKKISLQSGGARSGYSAGSSDAYSEGKAHGQAAGFGRSGKRKQLPGGGA